MKSEQCVALHQWTQSCVFSVPTLFTSFIEHEKHSALQKSAEVRCYLSQVMSTHPLDDPVSLSVTILALIEPSNDSLNVSSVVSSERPLTNNVLLCSVKREHIQKSFSLSKGTFSFITSHPACITGSQSTSQG